VGRQVVVVVQGLAQLWLYLCWGAANRCGFNSKYSARLVKSDHVRLPLMSQAVRIEYIVAVSR
jgi:hypothetical protein